MIGVSNSWFMLFTLTQAYLSFPFVVSAFTWYQPDFSISVSGILSPLFLAMTSPDFVISICFIFPTAVSALALMFVLSFIFL